MEEARRQLLDVGYSAFTISSVRSALGLSSGSMFHAFASKPDLVAHVFVTAMMEYQRVATAAIAEASDPVEAIEHYIAVHLLWVEEHRDLARFLFATQPDEVIDAAGPALREANAAFDQTLADLIAQAVESELMAPMPAAAARALVIGATQEYCRQWTRGKASVPPSRLTRPFQAAALAALAATASTEGAPT